VRAPPLLLSSLALTRAVGTRSCKGSLLTRRAYGGLARRIAATLLLSAVRSISNGAAYSADSPTGKASIAAISSIGRTIDREDFPKTPRALASANLPSLRLTDWGVNSEQNANPRQVVEAVRAAPDLRPPDPQSNQAQRSPEPPRPANADSTLHVDGFQPL
jgi:hypothetical protein